VLGYFEPHTLAEITPAEVDRYVQAKLREGKLSAGSINRTVGVLAAVLEDAVEYGYLERNDAKGRRRKLPTSAPTRAHLEPDHVEVLLAAAGELDAAEKAPCRRRRPMLATLAYAGLRVGELLALRWRDVDLAAGRLWVRASKTKAGVRSIDIQPELHTLTGRRAGRAPMLSECAVAP
jgi:integrase